MNSPTVPQEREAEIALLGSIFIDENIIFEISDLLSPDDFYDSQNRLIYKAMLELSKSGKSIDVTTVLAQLTAFNVLEQSGGIDYISEIADYSYSPRNVETYVELSENASLRRDTINT